MVFPLIYLIYLLSFDILDNKSYAAGLSLRETVSGTLYNILRFGSPLCKQREIADQTTKSYPVIRGSIYKSLCSFLSFETTSFIKQNLFFQRDAAENL